MIGNSGASMSSQDGLAIGVTTCSPRMLPEVGPPALESIYCGGTNLQLGSLGILVFVFHVNHVPI